MPSVLLLFCTCCLAEMRAWETKRGGVDGGRGVCSGPLARRGGLKRASVRSMSCLMEDSVPPGGHAAGGPAIALGWATASWEQTHQCSPGQSLTQPKARTSHWPCLSMAHQGGEGERAGVGTSFPNPTLRTSSSAWPFLFSSLAPGGHFLQGVTTGCCFLSPDPRAFWACRLLDLGLWDPLDNCLLASPFPESLMPGAPLGTYSVCICVSEGDRRIHGGQCGLAFLQWAGNTLRKDHGMGAGIPRRGSQPWHGYLLCHA